MPTAARSAELEPPTPHLQLVPQRPVLRAVEPLADALERDRSAAITLESYPTLDHQVIGRIAATAYEVAEGIRQVAHLGRWITPEVANQLSALRALNVERRSLNRDTRRAVPTVLCVRAASPSPGAIEATVVLNTPGKARGAALRFEFQRGIWKASYLAVM